MKLVDVFKQTNAKVSFRLVSPLLCILLVLWLFVFFFKRTVGGHLRDDEIEYGWRTGNRDIRKEAVSTSRHEMIRS